MDPPLSRVGIQLSTLFLRCVSHASFANDICGQPLPPAYVNPWKFFDGKLFQSEFEKTIVFIVVFLENSENFLNFAKSSKLFGEFLNFLGFSKIIENSLVFSYALLNFPDFSRML